MYEFNTLFLIFFFFNFYFSFYVVSLSPTVFYQFLYKYEFHLCAYVHTYINFFAFNSHAYACGEMMGTSPFAPEYMLYNMMISFIYIRVVVVAVVATALTLAIAIATAAVSQSLVYVYKYLIII